jgi:hypothetical protein
MIFTVLPAASQANVTFAISKLIRADKEKL